MNFILICLWIYLFIKYRDLTKDFNNTLLRLQSLEELVTVGEDNNDITSE